MAMLMSHDARVELLPTVSIRATNSAAADAVYWAPAFDVRPYHDIYAKLKIGATWDANDNVTTCKLQQCTAADGTGAKDLTTSSATGDYDTDTPIDATGNTVVLEARAEDMDMDNGFYYVRLYAASTDNTGQDDVLGVIVLYNARNKYAEREAAASAGAVVYGTAA